ncbi:MAG: IPT/TIG domain-containing protein [Vicinamibacterales bacterium]
MTSWTAPRAQTPRQFYVSPSGAPSNDGSIGRPLDIATALSSLGPVRPGDTVWLRGGVYRRPASLDSQGDPVVFVSTLTGTAAAPIVVRQYPGERATLDGNLAPSTRVLVVHGSYAWYWGFEITNSDPNRSVTRGDGLSTYGHHNRFINLVIHDTGNGVGFWATGPADDSEIYGSVISHVGWEGDDRGHGHSIYVQNVNGAKRIADNILFDGFSFGVHAYTSNGRIDNISVTGNIAFNHGNLSARSGPKANILFAGGQVAQNPVVTGNFGYYPAGSDGRSLDVSGCNNGRIQNNYLAGGTPLRLSSCSATVVTGNTTYGPVASATQAAYPANVYGATPTGVAVGIRPNTYEPGRANIAVYNWARHASVPVDLATVLPVGTPFEMRDAQNFYGPPVTAGVYAGGTITVPMAGLTPAPVIGTVPIPARHTGPEFGTFVLLPTAAVTPPPGLRLDAVSPATGGAGGGFNLQLAGAGFDAATAVSVGGAAATGVVVHSATLMTVTAPAHPPGVVDVVVMKGGQQASRPGGLTYQPVAPWLGPVSVTGSRLRLAWAAGAQTPVRGFYLLGGLAPGSSEFGPFPMGLSTATAAVVAPGRYYARVVADTAWGLLTSNEVVADVGAAAVPGAPALAPASVAGHTVSLSWSAVPGATGYVVIARLSPTGPVVAALPVAGTGLVVAAPPGVFHVSVVARNAAAAGPESNQVLVTVP